MRKEFQVFDEFIESKSLRHTYQRERILSVFLSTEKHVSVDDLYKLVKKQYPDIGYTTVYRTMGLFFESGLCEEIDFGDGIERFEHKYGHEHHDHLVCTKCGRFIEVSSPEIEKIQEKMAKKHSFATARHKLDIFGKCKVCLKKG
ncbi:MAG: transcriptional repressor [Candidatus Omnitrophota bacterium]|nr:transcriptional repressor [Candidatus Omnitrophota bacterium]